MLVKAGAAFAALSIGLLCWPMIGSAQMVGPTPQPSGIPVTPEEAEQVQPEGWAIHGQATLTWLLQPAFRSPYQGPQSLSPAANGRETIDATLYAGVRPWPGAEIWLNPEVDQGFGLSDTFGVAGYPSGEAFKLGKAFTLAPGAAAMRRYRSIGRRLAAKRGRAQPARQRVARWSST